MKGSVSHHDFFTKRMDSPTRADFYDGFKAGGKYEGTIGIYRHNTSSERIGIFDKELVDTLPSSVGWIAHNGAGYDQIDVAACKAKGSQYIETPSFSNDSDRLTKLYITSRNCRIEHPWRSR